MTAMGIRKRSPEVSDEPSKYEPPQMLHPAIELRHGVRTAIVSAVR